MHNKRLHVFIPFMIIFMVVLLFNAHASYSDSASGIRQTAMQFLEHVAGFNLTHYQLVSFDSTEITTLDRMHTQTDVKTTLVGNESKLDVWMRFFDGKLWHYGLALASKDLQGQVQDLNAGLMLVQNAVSEYELRLNITHCHEFSQMLCTVMQNRNYSIENGNALLKVNYGGNTSTPIEYLVATWFCKVNFGLVTPFRSVQISISKTGLMTRFTDNLAVYHFVSTNVISQQEAISIATPYIQQYAKDHSQQITSVNATLGYVNDIASSRGDQFGLYPQWTVEGSYSSLNDDNVYGYTVMIWADNGKVHHHDPQGAYLPHTTSPSTIPILIIGATAATIATLFAVTIYKKYQRKRK